jgi:hypothetical protein
LFVNQNDITRNYKEIIGNINKSIDWAVDNDIYKGNALSSKEFTDFIG